MYTNNKATKVNAASTANSTSTANTANTAITANTADKANTAKTANNVNTRGPTYQVKNSSSAKQGIRLVWFSCDQRDTHPWCGLI